MKNTKNWKKLMTLTCIACLSMAAFFSPVTTLTVQAAEPETIAPRSDDIRWVFKEVDGKLYRRLYNYTIADWASDSWEYVGEL